MAKCPVPNNREVAILAALISGRKYGREIRDDYQDRTGEKMPLGSLYTTLARMEEKGFLKSTWGESVHQRGGNRRKYFELKAPGYMALNAFNARFTGLAKLLRNA